VHWLLAFFANLGVVELEVKKLGDRGVVTREEVLPLVRRKFIQLLALGWKRRTIRLFIDFVEVFVEDIQDVYDAFEGVMLIVALVERIYFLNGFFEFNRLYFPFFSIPEFVYEVTIAAGYISSTSKFA
jgi:hypothetical protein